MEIPTVNRRRFLNVAAASAALVAIGGTDEAAADGGDVRSVHFPGQDLWTAFVVGDVEPGSMLVALSAGENINLVLAEGADIHRGYVGKVADLSSFQAGEEIVVAGLRNDSAISAVDVRSMYRRVDATLLEVGEDGVLKSSAGRLLLPDVVREETDPQLLSPGTLISATVWPDPQTHETTVLVLRRN